MENEQIIKILTEAGGQLWEKNGKRRIYFNEDVLLQHAGLSTHRYNTGNISAASLNGQSISNSEAKRMISAVQLGKFWYDLEDGKFWSRAEMGSYDWIWKNFYNHLKSTIA